MKKFFKLKSVLFLAGVAVLVGFAFAKEVNAVGIFDPNCKVVAQPFFGNIKGDLVLYNNLKVNCQNPKISDLHVSASAGYYGLPANGIYYRTSDYNPDKFFFADACSYFPSINMNGISSWFWSAISQGDLASYRGSDLCSGGGWNNGSNSVRFDMDVPNSYNYNNYITYGAPTNTGGEEPQWWSFFRDGSWWGSRIRFADPDSFPIPQGIFNFDFTAKFTGNYKCDDGSIFSFTTGEAKGRSCLSRGKNLAYFDSQCLPFSGLSTGKITCPDGKESTVEISLSDNNPGDPVPNPLPESSASVDLKVNGKDNLPISGDPSSMVKFGSSVQLTWTSSGTIECYSPDFETNRLTQNNSGVPSELLAQNKGFFIFCTTPSGDIVSDYANVDPENPPPPIYDKTVPSCLSPINQTITFSWKQPVFNPPPGDWFLHYLVKNFSNYYGEGVTTTATSYTIPATTDLDVYKVYAVYKTSVGKQLSDPLAIYIQEDQCTPDSSRPTVEIFAKGIYDSAPTKTPNPIPYNYAVDLTWKTTNLSDDHGTTADLCQIVSGIWLKDKDPEQPQYPGDYFDSVNSDSGGHLYSSKSLTGEYKDLGWNIKAWDNEFRIKCTKLDDTGSTVLGTYFSNIINVPVIPVINNSTANITSVYSYLCGQGKMKIKWSDTGFSTAYKIYVFWNGQEIDTISNIASNVRVYEYTGDVGKLGTQYQFQIGAFKNGVEKKSPLYTATSPASCSCYPYKTDANTVLNTAKTGDNISWRIASSGASPDLSIGGNLPQTISWTGSSEINGKIGSPITNISYATTGPKYATAEIISPANSSNGSSSETKTISCSALTISNVSVAPSNLQTFTPSCAVGGPGRVDLSWSPVAGATSYKILRILGSHSSTKIYNEVATIPPETVANCTGHEVDGETNAYCDGSFEDNVPKLTPNKIYTYKVSALVGSAWNESDPVEATTSFCSPIVASCRASASSYPIGSTVNWTASASGGTGSYSSYSWFDGTNSGETLNPSFSTTYSSSDIVQMFLSVTGAMPIDQSPYQPTSEEVSCLPVTITSLSCPTVDLRVDNLKSLTRTCGVNNSGVITWITTNMPQGSNCRARGAPYWNTEVDGTSGITHRQPLLGSQTFDSSATLTISCENGSPSCLPATDSVPIKIQNNPSADFSLILNPATIKLKQIKGVPGTPKSEPTSVQISLANCSGFSQDVTITAPNYISPLHGGGNVNIIVEKNPSNGKIVKGTTGYGTATIKVSPNSTNLLPDGEYIIPITGTSADGLKTSRVDLKMIVETKEPGFTEF